MSLYMFEFVPAQADRSGVDNLLARVDKAAAAAGGELIESQVTHNHERVFTIVEAASRDALRAAFDPADFVEASEVSGPDEVRLVGAELDQVKAARPAAGYLVEWDFPPDLDMDTYLARKKANAPKYAEVPEVRFLRTYVREDMAKCVCLYDAPDEQVVRRARDVVNTPVDRLHPLERQGDPR